MSSSDYGNDLVLFDDDLVLGANGDFFTSSDYEANNPTQTRFDGYYNIIFSAFNRLNTIRGEIPFHPEYGSSLALLVSRPNNKITADLIKQEFTDGLKSDPRIREVKRVDVEHSGNQMSVKAELVLSGKSESSIFVFPNFFIE